MLAEAETNCVWGEEGVEMRQQRVLLSPILWSCRIIVSVAAPSLGARC